MEEQKTELKMIRMSEVESQEVKTGCNGNERIIYKI